MKLKFPMIDPLSLIKIGYINWKWLEVIKVHLVQTNFQIQFYIF